MKKVCINQKWFERSLGYGAWSVVSIVLISFVIISTNEINTIVYNPISLTDGLVDDICYTSFFEGKKCFTELQWYHHAFVTTPHESQTMFIAFLIIDFGLIGVWIYHKQQKVKFALCERNSITDV